MPGFIDLTGRRFGKWTVVGRSPNGVGGHAMWLCRCDCGREKIVWGLNLRHGYSSGCQICQNRITKHGQWQTPLYGTWENMINRCENSNYTGYKRYGGRGIKICSEWRNDFKAFRRWALVNGYKEGLTIDRIDNDGDYEPENCQFLTRSENSLKAWHIDGSHGEKHLTIS